MNQAKLRQSVKTTVLYFLKWSVIALVIGGIGGFAGGLFAKAILFVTELRMLHDWLLYLLPVSGLLIVWLYQVTHEEKNRGTNMVLEAISSQEEVTAATGPLIFISTVLTHLTGGSAGREGAALQLGGSIGTLFGKWLHLDEKDQKMAVMCGMSAVFAALFGTPVAAGIFSLEVITIGILHYSAMLPCLFSAFLGTGAAGLLGVTPEAYEIVRVPELTMGSAVPILVLGVLCAMLSIVFCLMLHKSEHLYRKFFPNPYVRILVASALFIGLTLLSGTRIYNGSSVILIEESIAGKVRYEAFALKLLFTAVALGGGFKGGEIVPTLCVGATFGAAFGSLIGFEPSLCAACGMIALFAGVTNCPITSVLIAMELFGGEGLPYFALAIAVSFALSGYYGLYSSQKFAYSKIHNQYINRKTN